MAPTDRRPALSASKKRRPHPASPEAAARIESAGGAAGSDGENASGDGPVMLCARVARSLRQRIKLVAVETGRSVQDLVAEALEAECRRHGG